MDKNNMKIEYLKHKTRDKFQEIEKSEPWKFPDGCVPEGEKRVAVYCRAGKSDSNVLSGLELQKRYYINLFNRHPNWKPEVMYCDEGYDGNIGFKKMMEDARAGMFDLVITKNIFRFYQATSIGMDVVMELCQLPHPIGILFENENIYFDKNNIDMLQNIMKFIEEEEREKTNGKINRESPAGGSQATRRAGEKSL